jgi:exonuclease SbcC
MEPLSVHLENVGPFPSLDLDLPQGIVALVGPNAAGKSTILNSIEAALFARGARDLAPMLGPFDEKLSITLTFEHGGETFRVRRTYDGRGRGKATMDLEQFGGPTGFAPQPLTRETTAETQVALERLLGLSRRTFNASAFLGQGNAAMFADADPAERKAILAEVLDGRGLWPALCDRARADAREADAEIAVARLQAEALEARIAERPTLEEHRLHAQVTADTAETELLATEGALGIVQKALAENAAALERVRRLTDARDRAAADRMSAEEQHRQAAAADIALVDARRELHGVTARAQMVPLLEERDRCHRDVVEANKAAVAKRLELLQWDVEWRRNADRLSDETDILTREHGKLVARLFALTEAVPDTERCDRCEQLLGVEARAAALKSMTDESDHLILAIGAKAQEAEEQRALADKAAADAKAIVIPEPPEDVTEALAAARAADRQRGSLAERVAQLEQQAARMPELVTVLTAATEALAEREAELFTARDAVKATGDEGSLIRAVDDAKVEVMRRRRTLAEATEAVTRATVALEQVKEAEVELAATKANVANLQQRLDTLRLAERCFGRDGVPVLLLETVLPQIEAEANRVLELMPTSKGETFRVELRTLREQKTTEALRETLDVVVYGAGDPRPYETFSGGERSRLNIALRVALAHVLATRRGAEVSVLLVDELEFLDSLGQDQLVDVLRSLEGVFTKIVFVSHQERIRDAFDQTIVLETDGNGASRVVGSGQEVAA